MISVFDTEAPNGTVFPYITTHWDIGPWGNEDSWVWVGAKLHLANQIVWLEGADENDPQMLHNLAVKFINK
jgi:hypothetical protein